MALTRYIFGSWVRRFLMLWCGRRHLQAGGEIPFSVAIVKLDRLGDFVLATGAIHRIVEHYGEKQCLLVVSPIVVAFAAKEFPEVTLYVMPCGLSHLRAAMATFRHRRSLCRMRVDTVICLRHQRFDYDELVLTWLGGRRSIRVLDDYTRRFEPRLRLYDYNGSGGFVPEQRELLVSKDGVLLSRELEWHRQLLVQVFSRVVEDWEVLPCLSPNNKEGDVIIVTPFGSEKIRDFPEALLVETVEILQRKLQKPVVFIGLPTQIVGLRQAASLLKKRIGPVEIQAELSTEGYRDLISRAACVVTADTATAHIATAFDRLAIIALGGGHYGQFGPWQRSWQQQWLTYRIDCEGCSWNCCRAEPECLTRIGLGVVQKAVDRIFPNN